MGRLALLLVLDCALGFAQSPATVRDVSSQVSAALAAGPCPYDLNADGVCDVRDLQMLVAAMLNAPANCAVYVVVFDICAVPLDPQMCPPSGMQFRQIISACG